MTDPIHHISRYLPVIKKIPKADVMQIGELSEEQTAAAAEAVRQSRGVFTLVEADGVKASEKLKSHQLHCITSLDMVEWTSSSLDWVFLLIDTASYKKAVLLETFQQIEKAVRPKRSISFVMETDSPEEWHEELRRAFLTWRIVVDKKQEGRLLFTAQK